MKYMCKCIGMIFPTKLSIRVVRSVKYVAANYLMLNSSTQRVRVPMYIFFFSVLFCCFSSFFVYRIFIMILSHNITFLLHFQFVLTLISTFYK